MKGLNDNYLIGYDKWNWEIPFMEALFDVELDDDGEMRSVRTRADFTLFRFDIKVKGS